MTPELLSLIAPAISMTNVSFTGIKTTHQQSLLSEDLFRDMPDPLDESLLKVVSNNIAGIATCLPLLAPSNPAKNKRWIWEHINSIELSTELSAGLFLIHDYLEESHQLSQSIEGKGIDNNGDYWHAIMHRREPDYSNAKYWFRRVGEHPIYAQLLKSAFKTVEESHRLLGSMPKDSENFTLMPEEFNRLVKNNKWDPFVFVDICEMCADNPNEVVNTIARIIQWAEMILLMEHCYGATE